MPAHGRAGWAAIAIALLVAGAPAAFTGDSEAKRKRCRASEVKQTVTYRNGGRTHRAAGCAPRFGTVPAGMGAALPVVFGRVRAFALDLMPPTVKKLRRATAARKVLRADRVTDAALAGRAAATAQAASVTTTGPDSKAVDGPPGTRSTVRGTETRWSGNEPKVGREVKGVVDTTSTRLAGSDSQARKRVEFKYLMDRCPDGGGLGRGTVSHLQTDQLTINTAEGGRAITTTTGRFEGDVVAHFADNARIASVDITGTWSWSTDSRRGPRRTGATTRVSHHATSGTAAAEAFHQSESGGSIDSHVDIKPTVTAGTDDATAIAGNYLGRLTAVMPDLDIEEMLDGIQARALGGACVHVVPDPPTVHVSPSSTVPIAAHLVDSTGASFSGPVTTTSDRVQPQRADANPDAHVTYAAAASPPPGGFDTVRLDHVSRRGAAFEAVKVVYDSFDYRVLAATLDETVTGERPPDFPQCPASGSQTNVMSLGPQPFDPRTSSDGHLFDTGQDRSGQIRASGMSTMSSNMKGCDVGSTPTSCSGTGSAQTERDVTVQVDLPKAGGPARVQWSFNQDPAAGIGNESHGTCLTYMFHGHTDDASLGVRTVPREIFESDGPSDLSIEVTLDLPNDQGGTVHAVERYTLRIQKVAG
jgi:hypothetical protein